MNDPTANLTVEASTPEEHARRALESMLRGEEPPDTPNDAYGDYSSDMEKALKIFRNGAGVQGVGAFLETHRALAELVPGNEARGAPTWFEQSFTLSDVPAQLPPVEHVVGGVITRGSLNVFFGAPGCFKSFVLADLAVCVAGGIPWLRPFPHDAGHSFPVCQTPVVWLDCDNGKRRTMERFLSLIHI